MRTYFRIILKHLNKKTCEENIYFFHDKYSLSPGQIAHFIEYFTERKIIVFHQGKLTITDKGRIFIKQNKDLIYFPQRKDWLKVPSHMKSEHIMEINEPFIPHLNHKDISSFIKYLNKH